MSKERIDAGVNMSVGRSVARRYDASFVYRYAESLENVSGDGMQSGTTGKVICPMLSGSVAVDFGNVGRWAQCDARIILCIGKSVTRRIGLGDAQDWWE